MKQSPSHTLRGFEKHSGGDVLSFMSLSPEEIKNQQLTKPGFYEQSRGVVGRLLVCGQVPFGRSRTTVGQASRQAEGLSSGLR